MLPKKCFAHLIFFQGHPRTYFTPPKPSKRLKKQYEVIIGHYSIDFPGLRIVEIEYLAVSSGEIFHLQDLWKPLLVKGKFSKIFFSVKEGCVEISINCRTRIRDLSNICEFFIFKFSLFMPHFHSRKQDLIFVVFLAVYTSYNFVF